MEQLMAFRHILCSSVPVLTMHLGQSGPPPRGTVTPHIYLPWLGSKGAGPLVNWQGSPAEEVPRPREASGPASNGHRQIQPGCKIGPMLKPHLECSGSSETVNRVLPLLLKEAYWD